MSRDSRIDWSEEKRREMLILQRRSMWHDDTVANLAAWLGFKPGMTVVDVGCGLGYLGTTYWPSFGKGGVYIGLDRSGKLCSEAAEMAREWAISGDASFVCADAYHLPLPDNFSDCVMCQTLMMHLEYPDKALAEMIRVAKPGGVIYCKEPDNLSSLLAKSFVSLPPTDLDIELLIRKVALVASEGRIKLGLGDNNIGPKLGHMMCLQGLEEVDARINDHVFLLEPPYTGEGQKVQIEILKKSWLDVDAFSKAMEKEEKEFLAGGGDPAEFDRYRNISDGYRKILAEQLEKGEMSWCAGSRLFIVKGRKPI